MCVEVTDRSSKTIGTAKVKFAYKVFMTHYNKNDKNNPFLFPVHIFRARPATRGQWIKTNYPGFHAFAFEKDAKWYVNYSSYDNLRVFKVRLRSIRGHGYVRTGELTQRKVFLALEMFLPIKRKAKTKKVKK